MHSFLWLCQCSDWNFWFVDVQQAVFTLHVTRARESRMGGGQSPADVSVEVSSELTRFNNVPHSTLKVTLSLQDRVGCTCNEAPRGWIQRRWDLDPPCPTQRPPPCFGHLPLITGLITSLNVDRGRNTRRKPQAAGIEPTTFWFDSQSFPSCCPTEEFIVYV